MTASKRLCVIDLGTNSFHAVITDLVPGKPAEIIDKLKEPVQLGEAGLGAELLTNDGALRAERALERIATLARRRGATDMRAYATSAIREATNGPDFVRHVRDTLGIEIEPISGEREAHLIYLGISDIFDFDRPALIVDIGGGSTELVVATTEGAIIERSLPLGAARLTERFVASDPISADDLEGLRSHLENELREVLGVCQREGVSEIIGSSGTMEALAAAAMHERGRTGEPYQHTFTPDELRGVLAELIDSDHQARSEMKSLDRRRVSQIVAGAVLVDFLMDHLDTVSFRISPAALREGMVAEYRQELTDGPSDDGDRDPVLRLADKLTRRHGQDPDHARVVADLACELFDQLEPLHELDHGSRTLLRAAALAHDVGHTISGRRHHKHTRYIIEQSRWPGVPPADVAVIANTARYHRRALPKKKHKPFAKLSKPNRHRVRKLAAILRLADKLDRSHVGNTSSLRIKLSPDAVHLTIATSGDPRLELSAGRRATKAFSQAFERDLHLHAAWKSAPAAA